MATPDIASQSGKRVQIVPSGYWSVSFSRSLNQACSGFHQNARAVAIPCVASLR